MSWLGQIRLHRRDEVWSTSLCQDFFVMTMGSQIPVIAEKPQVACGCRKFHLDTTTHKVKMQQHVTKIRGRRCGDIKVTTYLVNTAGPVPPLVLDLLITHDRFGSTSDPSLNGHLHYPNDIDNLDSGLLYGCCC
jgi:hypothetical protein